MSKDLKRRFAELEHIRLKRERAINQRVFRTFILSCYGLSDPKDLPEECKKCSNFYCTFCCKCRHLTKKATDGDCYVSNEQYTDNYKAYEKFCNAVIREHSDLATKIENTPNIETEIMQGDWVVRGEGPL